MKFTVSFEIDCTRTLEVLAEAGVPDSPEELAQYIEENVQSALRQVNMPGEMHADPRNGLPEVFVTVGGLGPGGRPL